MSELEVVLGLLVVVAGLATAARRLAVPPPILMLLGGGSLLNVATGLVTYRLALAAAASGTFSPGEATVSFGVVAVGGVAVGLAVGRAAAWIRLRLRDTPVSITVSILTPFAAYLA